MLVSAYCRVSTDSSDQANSYENQKSYFDREILAKGNTIFRIYAGKGLTGTKITNRPEFFSMLYDAGIDIKNVRTIRNDNRAKTKHTVFELSDRKPLFDEVWIKNTSRFARNTLSYELINLLRQKGVNIYFIEQGINTNDLAQDLLLKLMQIFDEQDSKDKSLKVKTGINESAKKGVLRTSGKLFGYSYNKDDNSLSIIESEAEIVRSIFNLCASGIGSRRIIAYLTQHKMFTRNGKIFSKTTIRRILDNEKYAGLNNALKYDTGTVFNKNTYAKVKDEYDVEKCERIPAIISSELFYLCKSILDSNVNRITSKGIYHGVSKYGKLLICGACGSKYNANSDDGKRFYNCTGKRNLKNGCKSRNVYEKELDDYLSELFQRSGDTPQKNQLHIIYKSILYSASVIMRDYSEDKTELIAKIKGEIDVIKRRIEGYYDIYSDPGVRKDAILNRIKESEETLSGLESEYSNAIYSNKIVYDKLLKVKGILFKLSSGYKIQKPMSQEELLEQIDHITVMPDDLVPQMMYPDEIEDIVGHIDIPKPIPSVDETKIMSAMQRILNECAW